MSSLNCSGDEKHEGRRGICNVWQGFGPPIYKNAFSHLKVSSVALGQNHGLLLTVDRKVCSFGTGSALGNGVVVKNSCFPTPVGDLLNKNVIQVACGYEHSAAVCDDGTLYMWGENSEGQCGLPIEQTLILTPTLVKIKDYTHTCKLRDSVIWYKVKIQEVACGKSHSLALSLIGDLWSWGSLVGVASAPYKLKSSTLSERKILSICCGLRHNIAVVCVNSNDEGKPFKPSTNENVNESAGLNARTGCLECDVIVSSKEFSANDLIEERNCCPFGLSLEDGGGDALPSNTPPKLTSTGKRHAKNKKVKELVNAAVGAGKEVTLDSDGEIINEIMVDNTGDSTIINEAIDSNANFTSGIIKENDESENAVVEPERNNCTEVATKISENGQTDCSDADECPARSNRLSITESFRQGVGYLSVQSVQNFLSRQFSSSKCDSEPLDSSLPETATLQENIVDVVDSKTSSKSPISAPQTVSEDVHSSVSSPLDQFSFVYSDNWQAIEMTTYNSAPIEELQAVARYSNSLMSLNIDIRKHVDHVDLSPKGSSCERVNDIKDSSALDFELRLGSKPDSNSILNNSWHKCDILSWGNGFEGQLGHGDSLNRDEPIRIRALIDYEVVKVVSGHMHSLLLNACGQVYGWGSNSHGQLGLSSSEHPIILSPQIIKIPDNAFVWDIGAGAKSSIFLINRIGEQQLYICGKREGQFNETNSIKAETLTIVHNVQIENCKISQIFGGGSYFSCVMDQVTGGHLGVLYELTNTELSFFSFLNKLAATALIPILQNESLISSCGSTLQQLFESFIEISLNSARNGHRLRYIIQKADRKESRPLFHDLEQQLALYRKYCKHYCDALAINGFGIAVKTANSVFKIASKVLMEMSNSVDVKIAMAPETLQHLMEEPIRRMNQYKKLFFNLAQQRKQKNWCSFWESQAAEKWDKSIAWVAIEKQEAERTRAFWDIYPNKVSDALKIPGRRIIRDSKAHSVSLLNSGRFSSHWFILFNDILAHYHFSGLEKHDLSVTWVDPATGLEGKSNAFTLTFPEETLVLICDTSAEKTEWVSAINNAVDHKLKLKMNANASHLDSSRAATVRCNPPLVRHATYSFSKSSLYKDATYSGMWICGQLQGHGELSWGDGRQYIGQFKQNNQDGFGTYIVDSASGQTVYRGSWKNGKLNGLGNIKYPNGDTYEGYFKDKVRHGHGVLKCGRFVMSSASIYIGQWVNDKKEGYGVMDDIERAEKYIGNWLDDLPHGKGMLVTLDGIYFEGNFVKGQMGGIGLVYDDGGWYEGEVGSGHTFNGKGVLTLASGDSIEGHFTGYWNDNVKLSGTLKRSNKRKLLTEMIFPNSFTKLSVSADEKWTDIFYHCYEMLGINESSVDPLRKAWDSVAVILSNWKKTHWKKSSSKSIHANGDVGILERIPIDDTADFTFEKYLDIKNYLYMAFDTPYHPLGRLIDGLVDVFRASYVGTGAHLCLLHHAVDEVRSFLRRINDVIRILFPCLPATGEQVAFNMSETNELQNLDSDSATEIVTSDSLLLPILLPKIHPPLFTLYALRHENDDNIYWETLMKWNKQSDIALMAFLGVDQQFWTSVDAGYLVDKRASMSTIRDCNYTKAIDTLQQLSTTFSPIEKLQVVQKAFEEINNEVQGKISSTYMWTMDDLFPVFEYVVVRAGIRHLGSEIHMMDDLMEKRFQNGELGIMFTMLRVPHAIFKLKTKDVSPCDAGLFEILGRKDWQIDVLK